MEARLVPFGETSLFRFDFDLDLSFGGWSDSGLI